MIKIKSIFAVSILAIVATAHASDNVFFPHQTARTIDEYGIPWWDDSIYNPDLIDFADNAPMYQEYNSTNDIFDTQKIQIVIQEPSCEIESPICDFKRMPRAANIMRPMVLYTSECPFNTDLECHIWRTKPHVRETVAPRRPVLAADRMDNIIAALQCDGHLDANDPDAAPLLARYKLLMAASNSCCRDGITYHLRRAGATPGLVYKFVLDDANFYGFGARCLMMSDADLSASFAGGTATAETVADVRNACLCPGRAWFNSLLAPFGQIYAAVPWWENHPFEFTYTDGLQRQITVDINRDVRNVMNQLASCP